MTGAVIAFAALAMFAVLAFALSVVSFPLLLDRNVGVPVAIATSVRAILKNPGTMVLWGLIVAAGLALGSLPFFFGLAVVMPVLGHATWHLYRRVVEPDSSPRPEYHPQPKGRRYYWKSEYLPVIEPDGRSTGRQAVVYTAALLPVALAPTLLNYDTRTLKQLAMLLILETAYAVPGLPGMDQHLRILRFVS